MNGSTCGSARNTHAGQGTNLKMLTIRNKTRHHQTSEPNPTHAKFNKHAANNSLERLAKVGDWGSNLNEENEVLDNIIILHFLSS